jgi:hypothetical protein
MTPAQRRRRGNRTKAARTMNMPHHHRQYGHAKVVAHDRRHDSAADLGCVGIGPCLRATGADCAPGSSVMSGYLTIGWPGSAASSSSSSASSSYPAQLEFMAHTPNPSSVMPDTCQADCQPGQAVQSASRSICGRPRYPRPVGMEFVGRRLPSAELRDVLNDPSTGRRPALRPPG